VAAGRSLVSSQKGLQGLLLPLPPRVGVVEYVQGMGGFEYKLCLRLANGSTLLVQVILFVLPYCLQWAKVLRSEQANGCSSCLLCIVCRS
jgi:hypothetical protein